MRQGSPAKQDNPRTASRTRAPWSVRLTRHRPRPHRGDRQTTPPSCRPQSLRTDAQVAASAEEGDLRRPLRMRSPRAARPSPADARLPPEHESHEGHEPLRPAIEPVHYVRTPEEVTKTEKAGRADRSPTCFIKLRDGLRRPRLHRRTCVDLHLPGALGQRKMAHSNLALGTTMSGWRALLFIGVGATVVWVQGHADAERRADRGPQPAAVHSTPTRRRRSPRPSTRALDASQFGAKRRKVLLGTPDLADRGHRAGRAGADRAAARPGPAARTAARAVPACLTTRSGSKGMRLIIYGSVNRLPITPR